MNLPKKRQFLDETNAVTLTAMQESKSLSKLLSALDSAGNRKKQSEEYTGYKVDFRTLERN